MDSPEVPDIEVPEARNLTPWLIGLGGLAVIAAVLLAVKATRAKPSIVSVDDLTGDDADWRTSLRHLADAMQVRLDGIEERLNDLADERVAHTATTSMPPEPLVEQPAAPTPNGAMTAHTSTEEVAPPPGPASVSVQP